MISLYEEQLENKFIGKSLMTQATEDEQIFMQYVDKHAKRLSNEIDSKNIDIQLMGTFVNSRQKSKSPKAAKKSLDSIERVEKGTSPDELLISEQKFSPPSQIDQYESAFERFIAERQARLLNLEVSQKTKNKFFFMSKNPKIQRDNRFQKEKQINNDRPFTMDNNIKSEKNIEQKQIPKYRVHSIHERVANRQNKNDVNINSQNGLQFEQQILPKSIRNSDQYLKREKVNVINLHQTLSQNQLDQQESNGKISTNYQKTPLPQSRANMFRQKLKNDEQQTTANEQDNVYNVPYLKKKDSTANQKDKSFQRDSQNDRDRISQLQESSLQKSDNSPNNNNSFYFGIFNNQSSSETQSPKFKIKTNSASTNQRTTGVIQSNHDNSEIENPFKQQNMLQRSPQYQKQNQQTTDIKNLESTIPEKTLEIGETNLVDIKSSKSFDRFDRNLSDYSHTQPLSGAGRHLNQTSQFNFSNSSQQLDIVFQGQISNNINTNITNSHFLGNSYMTYNGGGINNNNFGIKNNFGIPKQANRFNTPTTADHRRGLHNTFTILSNPKNHQNSLKLNLNAKDLAKNSSSTALLGHNEYFREIHVIVVLQNEEFINHLKKKNFLSEGLSITATAINVKRSDFRLNREITSQEILDQYQGDAFFVYPLMIPRRKELDSQQIQKPKKNYHENLDSIFKLFNQSIEQIRNDEKHKSACENKNNQFIHSLESYGVAYDCLLREIDKLEDLMYDNNTLVITTKQFTFGKTNRDQTITIDQKESSLNAKQPKQLKHIIEVKSEPDNLILKLETEQIYKTGQGSVHNKGHHRQQLFEFDPSSQQTQLNTNNGSLIFDQRTTKQIEPAEKRQNRIFTSTIYQNINNLNGVNQIGGGGSRVSSPKNKMDMGPPRSGSSMSPKTIMGGLSDEYGSNQLINFNNQQTINSPSAAAANNNHTLLPHKTNQRMMSFNAQGVTSIAYNLDEKAHLKFPIIANDAVFKENQIQLFLFKFGFPNFRLISESLFIQAFWNHGKEELETIFAEFLLLCQVSSHFLEISYSKLLKEMSIQQKINHIFNDILYVKVSVLKEFFPLTRKVKESKFRAIMRHIKSKRQYTSSDFPIQDLREERIYWHEFIKFKAFYIEQRWSKEEKAIFILFVVNPESKEFIDLKQIQTHFAEIIKNKPKQMFQFLSCIKNQNYLDVNGHTPEHIFYQIIIKENHIPLNDLLSCLINV